MSRDTITAIQACWEFNRSRTLGLLDQIAETADPAAVLGWRPGAGRAHIAWQLMHTGITEELFATERLLGTPPGYADFVPRFKGGSTPDDDIPTVDVIRGVLNESRQHLLTTFEQFNDADLETIPAAFAERGWPLGKIIQVLAWHEAHHHGQAHAVFNLWKGLNA